MREKLKLIAIAITGLIMFAMLAKHLLLTRGYFGVGSEILIPITLLSYVLIKLNNKEEDNEK